MLSFLSKFPFLLRLIAKRLFKAKSSKSAFGKKRFKETTLTSPKHKQTETEQTANSQPNNEFAIEFASDLQQEIRQGRKFSIAEAIGREGGSFMKGESAVPRPVRAANTIKQFLDSQLVDPSSAFATTLFTWATADIRLSRQLDTPLVALTQILESLLSEPTTFHEFSRQVAIAHANLTGERPHFQSLGQPPHPDADYTHESIQAQLSALIRHIKLATEKTS
ncbi:MAG: hypothetical protein AAF810_07885 [Cyanobacteria bacterium P01_D01_bin.36]